MAEKFEISFENSELSTIIFFLGLQEYKSVKTDNKIVNLIITLF